MEIEENAQIEIEKHRAVIDSLDEQIVGLLNKRAEECIGIGLCKPKAQMGVYDPKREADLLTRLDELNDGPLYNDQIRTIYASILKVMKEIQA